MEKNIEYLLKQHTITDAEEKFKVDENYHKLLKDVVTNSFAIINENIKSKKRHRTIYTIIIFTLLFLQLILLFTFIGLEWLSNTAIITAFISLILETIGLVTIMVTFIFNDKSEIEIIKAIQEVVGSYKKNDDSSKKASQKND